MSSDTPHSISPTDAPSRLLFHRPDLVARRKQRKMAKKLSAWAGHTRSVVDVLAGCLAVLQDSSVEALVERLASSVEEAANHASDEERERIASRAYRIETAFNLGWSLLDEGPTRDALRVLALAGGGPLTRALLHEAAGADSATLDRALLAGFCFSDARDNITTDTPLVHYILKEHTDETQRERLRRRLLEAFHSALLDPLYEGADALEEAWEPCWALCSLPKERIVHASITHRWVQRLRGRGELGRALRLVEAQRRALRGCEDDGDSASNSATAEFLWLLTLDEAVLRIESGDVQSGLAHLEELISDPCDAQGGDSGIAPRWRRRAQLIRAQARAFYMRDKPAEDSLPELLVLDETSEAMHLTCTGVTLLGQGSYEQAEQNLIAARNHWNEGQPAQGSWIELSIALAQAQAQGGHIDDARKNLDAARIASGGDLDRRQLSSLPLALHELGLLAARQGNVSAAGTYLDEAAMLATNSLHPGHPTRLLITYHRGLVHLARGDLRQAESQFARVVEQCESSLRAQQYVVVLARCARAICWCVGTEDRRAKARGELREIRTALDDLPGEGEMHREVEFIIESYGLGA